MANNILGGLTGLPPNMTPQDWARITDTTAVLNKDPLNVTKTTTETKTYIANQDIMGKDFGGNSILAFKKGDEIRGMFETILVNGEQGIRVKNPKITGGLLLYVFVPLSKLTEIATKETPTEIKGSMKTYIVNQDIFDNLGRNDIVENTNKTKLFKKGDKIKADTIKDGGIYTTPTIPNKFWTTFFIPLDYLTEVKDSPNELSLDNTKLLQYAVIGLILYIVFIK